MFPNCSNNKFDFSFIRELPLEQKKKLIMQIDNAVNGALLESHSALSKSHPGGDKSWRRDIDQKGDPSSEYELTRRRVETNVLELWNFIRSEVSKAQALEHSDNRKLLEVLQNILNLGVEHKRYTENLLLLLTYLYVEVCLMSIFKVINYGYE